MFKVYYQDLKEKPVWLADFDAEEFAQVLVDAGNNIYGNWREFYFEDSAADDVIETDDDADAGWCPNCSGTGEGLYDGSHCIVCHGRGS